MGAEKIHDNNILFRHSDSNGLFRFGAVFFVFNRSGPAR